MSYNYKMEMSKDILDYIKLNIDLKNEESYDELKEGLYDELWIVDSVTGNGGMYYDTEIKCDTYLAYNLDLMIEACAEFCVDMKTLLQHYRNEDLARFLDCTIRCYLLGEVLDNVLNDIWKSK